MASLTAFLSSVMYQAVNGFAKADRITQRYLLSVFFNLSFLSVVTRAEYLR